MSVSKKNFFKWNFIKKNIIMSENNRIIENWKMLIFEYLIKFEKKKCASKKMSFVIVGYKFIYSWLYKKNLIDVIKSNLNHFFEFSIGLKINLKNS